MYIFKGGSMGKDIKTREYEDHEFCIAVKCRAFHYLEIICLADKCEKTAKDFHKWIKENNGKIIISQD